MPLITLKDIVIPSLCKPLPDVGGEGFVDTAPTFFRVAAVSNSKPLYTRAGVLKNTPSS
jgi:hypothetical protein